MPQVLVYSDDPAFRDAVRLAVGRRPSPDLPPVEFVEAPTGEALLEAVDAGGIDLVVVDGEARPTGGFGLAKQLKDEIADCPPVLLLVARKDDTWLAKWSLADAFLSLPVDPPATVDAVVELLKHREQALPVRRAAAL
ncbi:MAG: response regulator receiver protein [Frankiales bacterium]|nr:response regulator receiver protein [Frankiales bacterium]